MAFMQASSVTRASFSASVAGMASFKAVSRTKPATAGINSTPAWTVSFAIWRSA